MSDCNCPKCSYGKNVKHTETQPTTEDIVERSKARVEATVKLLKEIGPIPEATMVTTASEPPRDAELEVLIQTAFESGKIAQTTADAATRYMRDHWGELTHHEQLMYYPLSNLAWAYMSCAGAMTESTEHRMTAEQFEYVQSKTTLMYHIHTYAVRLLGAIDELQLQHITLDESLALTRLGAALEGWVNAYPHSNTNKE